MFKLSPGQLRSFERAEVIEPSTRLGSRPAFEFRDLVCVRSVLRLMESGVPLRRIKRSVEGLKRRLPEMERPAGALELWQPGSGRVVARHRGMLIEPNGQTLLDLRRCEPDAHAGDVVVLETREERRTAAEWFERGCELDGDPRSYDQAIEAYRRAVTLEGDFADAHCNLGAVLYNRGDREAARACFERALRIAPHHVEANLNSANLLEEDERNEAALHHYKAAMRSDPVRADVQLNLALLYEKLGLRLKAREHWRRYLAREPDGSWSEIARSRLEDEPGN